jgi:hypothetical protein
MGKILVLYMFILDFYIGEGRLNYSKRGQINL